MSQETVVAVDMIGGDEGAPVVRAGVQRALAADPGLSIVAVGPAEVVEPLAAAEERVTAQVATEAIAMGEHRAAAVRAKRDSSIVVGCRLVREGEAQGFFSAGSTGACLAAATLVMGRVAGVKRPALAQMLPGWPTPTLLLDVGANADCKPEYLAQFGIMGAAYLTGAYAVEAPRVGLLNIGEEDTKGSALALAAHELMAQQVPGFAGNCEGSQLLKGAFDVVVADGFTGNVCLKAIEGAASTVMGYLKRGFLGSAKAKVGALLAKGSLGEVKRTLSPSTYGGAPLLGVKGACIVGHGSSDAEAVGNGILVAAKAAAQGVDRLIAEGIAAAQAAPTSPAPAGGQEGGAR